MGNPIIVLGPGRCGTSMVAGLLHHLGVCMGEILVPATSANLHGHWEDAEIRDLNDALLSEKMRPEVWRKCIVRLFDYRQVTYPFWGWKDPRTCYLLKEYGEMVFQPTYIRIVRPLDECATSAHAAYGWPIQAATHILGDREKCIERHLGDEGHLFTFSEVKSDTDQIITDLISICGLRPSPDQIEQAQQFIVSDV